MKSRDMWTLLQRHGFETLERRFVYLDPPDLLGHVGVEAAEVGGE